MSDWIDRMLKKKPKSPIKKPKPILIRRGEGLDDIAKSGKGKAKTRAEQLAEALRAAEEAQ